MLYEGVEKARPEEQFEVFPRALVDGAEQCGQRVEVGQLVDEVERRSGEHDPHEGADFPEQDRPSLPCVECSSSCHFTSLPTERDRR